MTGAPDETRMTKLQGDTVNAREVFHARPLERPAR
jgi:hypothetical protein